MSPGEESTSCLFYVCDLRMMCMKCEVCMHLSHTHVQREREGDPHTVQLERLVVDSTSICSCLQYVNGGSLENLLQDHSISLSWTVRVQLAKDIAVGVAYLHRNGILHRDLNTRVSLSINSYVCTQTSCYVNEHLSRHNIARSRAVFPANGASSPHSRFN